MNGVLVGDAANVRLYTNGYVANFTSAGGDRDRGDGERVDAGGKGGGELHADTAGGLTANITALGVTITSG